MNRVDDWVANDRAAGRADGPHIETIDRPAPAPANPIQEDDDMPNVITNGEQCDEYNAGVVKWLLRDDGTKAHITEGYWAAGLGSPAGTPVPSALIKATCRRSSISPVSITEVPQVIGRVVCLRM